MNISQGFIMLSFLDFKQQNIFKRNYISIHWRKKIILDFKQKKIHQRKSYCELLWPSMTFAEATLNLKKKNILKIIQVLSKSDNNKCARKNLAKIS